MSEKILKVEESCHESLLKFWRLVEKKALQIPLFSKFFFHFRQYGLQEILSFCFWVRVYILYSLFQPKIRQFYCFFSIHILKKSRFKIFVQR